MHVKSLFYIKYDCWGQWAMKRLEIGPSTMARWLVASRVTVLDKAYAVWHNAIKD